MRKPKPTISAEDKSKAGKNLNLSLSSANNVVLDNLPQNFRSQTDELRKLDLSGQAKLAKDLHLIRFAGHTLTWLNLAGVDAQLAEWTFLKLCSTLFGMSKFCNWQYMLQIPNKLLHISPQHLRMQPEGTP